MKFTLGRLLLLLFGVAIVALIVYAMRPQPIDVDVAEVVQGRLRVTVDEDGKTRIKERYIVSAPLAGRMRRIDLDAGDPVTAGKTLLTTIAPTDPSLLDARALAQARARVQAAEAALNRTEPLVDRARLEMEHAESELARIRQLDERQAVSDQEVDEAELAFLTASEAYRAARFDQDIAQYELDIARAALLRSLPNQNEGASSLINGDVKQQPAVATPETDEPLDNAPHDLALHSPISGRVLRVMEESATIVTPGKPLIELGNPQDLEIEIDVLSSDAVKIKPGATVVLEQWGGDEPLEGIVRLVEPAGFTKISALGVEEQRVWVIADFSAPPESWNSLGDAYRVEARIVVWEADDVVKVPTSALFRDGDSWAVFCVEDGHARLRHLKIGRRNGLEAQVLQGLDADAQVIMHPSDKVADGVRVRQRPRG